MKLYLVTRKFSDLLYPKKSEIRATPRLRALFTVVIVLAMCSTIINTTYNYFARQLKHFIDFNFHGIKCDRCQYLDCNPHLKCAVHPSTVLTHQAVDCKDYHQIIDKSTLKPGIIYLSKILQNVI